MIYRTLGRTNLEVSEIGYGLWGMGGWSGSNDDESMESLRRSVDLGCNFFDTAWAYGSGHSDQILGRLIKEYPQKHLVVAGKIPPKNFVWPGRPTDKIGDVFPKDHITDYTERILRNLDVDTIDILQFHVWDDSWASDSEWQKAIADLKSQGMIRYFGLSLNRWEPENGLAALQTGLVDTVQVIYNIFDQAPEDKLFPLCKKLNVGVIARVPLDEGGLTGTLSKSTKFPDEDWRAKYFGPENLGPTVDRADALKKILPNGMKLPEMALRFVLSNNVVGTTIVGMRKLKYVNANISTSDGQDLPDELISVLRQHRWDRQVTPWAN